VALSLAVVSCGDKITTVSNNSVGGAPASSLRVVGVAELRFDHVTTINVTSSLVLATTVVDLERLGNGNGTFQQRAIATGSNPLALVLGDVNADGIPDLIVANNGNATIGVFLGNGDGTFRPSPQPPLAVSSELTFLAIGDLTGDGRLYIVATSTGTHNLALLVGNGDGTFQPAQTIAAAGPQANSVAIGDMNGDGMLDLVITRQAGNSSTVSLLLGTGGGSFPARLDFDTGEDVPTYATLAGLNRDGILDVVIGNENNNANSIAVLLGRP
jgi:hypothetical protein